MIYNFELFNEYITKKEIDVIINTCSTEFWSMVKIANWNKVIKTDLSIKNKKVLERKQSFKIYSKYSFNKIKEFKQEYDDIKSLLYLYFEDYWLGDIIEFDDGYDVSDDGFDDLLSSIIGKGKLWVIKCLKNPKIPQQMANKYDYAENFGYQLDIDKSKYHEIRSEFDPKYNITRTFNI